MNRSPYSPRPRLHLESLEERCVLSAAAILQSQPALLPNDPLFGQQWDMRNTAQSGGKADADTDADIAWGVSSTSRITTAVVDSGLDYTHPDLYLNVWLNQGEIPASIRSKLVDTDGDRLITFRDLNDARNQGAGKITDLNRNGYIDGGDILKSVSQGGWADGISNDGDAYKDDLIGWNFISNTNDPMDTTGHGTHVSGTIGAVGNNGIGVAGTAWNTQIMGLRAVDSTTGTTDTIARALDYAFSHGAKVVNGSWALTGPSAVLKAALDRAQTAGVVVVTAAGNYAADLDKTPYYPASYTNDNIVSVAATDNQDRLASYSSYGANTVDIAAPGTNILSTNPNKAYGNRTGTSMATPHVAGAIALVWSQHPEWTYKQVIAQVLDTADRVPSLAGKVASGRLNVGAAMTQSVSRPLPSSTTEWTAWAVSAGWQDVVTGDFDGDGKDDIAGRTTNGQWWIGREVGGTLATSLWSWWSESAGWRDVRVGDFNGDGKDDIAARTADGHWWVGRSTGTAFATAHWASWNEAAYWRDVRVGDFDGDGKDDLVARTSGGFWFVARSTGAAFATTLTAWWSEPAGWRDVRVGDFDGDGKDDVAGRTSDGHWWVNRSTGTAFATAHWASWNEAADWRDVRVGDFDGDGKDDLAGRTSGGYWFVARGTGAAFATTLWASWNEAADWRDVRVGDFDGDGKDDLAARTSAGQWWLARSRDELFATSLWL